MIVRCKGCGLEQPDRTGVPASKNIPREQGVSVCVRCGGICSDCAIPIDRRIVWVFGEARCCGSCAVARMKKGEKVGHAE